MVSTSFILFDHAGSQVNALDWIRFNSRDSRTPEPSNRDSRLPELSKQGRVSGLSAVSACQRPSLLSGKSYLISLLSLLSGILR